MDRMKIKKNIELIGIVAIVIFCACAVGDAIKNRLPAPHNVMDGVIFQYENAAARQVQLCGNFNNWCGTKDTGGLLDPSVGNMSDDDGDGIWELTFDLSPGRYQYKLVIDRVSWVMDPSNPNTDFEDGFENSLVIVR